MALTVSRTELHTTATTTATPAAATATSFYDAATAAATATLAKASAKLATTANECSRLSFALAGPASTCLRQNGSGSSYGFLHASWQSVSSVASSLLLPTFGCTTTKATAVAASTATPFSTTTATAANGQQQFTLWGF